MAIFRVFWAKIRYGVRKSGSGIAHKTSLRTRIYKSSLKAKFASKYAEGRRKAPRALQGAG